VPVVSMSKKKFDRLEPIDLSHWLDRLHHVIVGGGSGVGNRSRPMRPDWLCALRDQVQAGGLASFVKQLGSNRVVWPGRSCHEILRAGAGGGADVGAAGISAGLRRRGCGRKVRAATLRPDTKFAPAPGRGDDRRAHRDGGNDR
jgi:hypothetical protein